MKAASTRDPIAAGMRGTGSSPGFAFPFPRSLANDKENACTQPAAQIEPATRCRTIGAPNLPIKKQATLEDARVWPARTYSSLCATSLGSIT